MLKKRLIPCLIIIGLIILIVAGVFLAGKYMPTKEPADLTKVFGVTGEKTAIFLNNEMQEATGITRDGQTYLPISWVNEYLNERFYWDRVEKLLVYTLPDSIVYADKRTMGSEGKPLLLEEDGEIYLAAGLVGNYTNIRMEVFIAGEHKRIFIDNSWDPWQAGTSGKETAVRVKDGIKSPVLTTLVKGQEFQIVEQMVEWSRIRTKDGYIGYIQNKLIEDTRMEQETSLFVEPLYTSISLEEDVCLVWHQVTAEAANDAMPQLIASTKGVNVIAPTWFMLTDNEGNYHSFASREYVDLAHEMGMQVWSVLDNFNMGENVDSEVLFSRTSARKALISNLMADVEEYNLDGINLDIESIKPAAGPHYVQFIRELSVACRSTGTILSVDNYVPSTYTSFYNRPEQGNVVDYVIMMGYDEHYAGGEAGSVASIPYVEKGIQDLLLDVPAEKIVCGVPFYTRVWTEKDGKTTSTALGLSSAKTWVEENEVQLYWQEELGQYYGELQTEDGYKAIWMEDETSLGLKMGLIEEYGLAGVACWKLGFEPASIWDVVKVNE